MHGLNFLNAAFLAQVLAFSFEHASAHRSPLSGRDLDIKYNVLRPVDEFHPTLGRRSIENKLDTKNLQPDDELMLQWAAQNEDGTFLHAQLDLTSDDSKLLFMSRFQGFTSSVDCSIRDGDGLSIVFKTPEYLELAKEQWGWLTQDEG